MTSKHGIISYKFFTLHQFFFNFMVLYEIRHLELVVSDKNNYKTFLCFLICGHHMINSFEFSICRIEAD